MNTQVTRGAGTILVVNDRDGDRGRPYQRHAAGDQGREDPAHHAAEQPDQPDPDHRRCLAGWPRSVIGLWRNTPFYELFLTAVAFSVSAIPTGLPAVVTAVLADAAPRRWPPPAPS